MKVRELIDKLKTMPEESEVMLYLGLNAEEDGWLDGVYLVESDGENSPYYCQGDSYFQFGGTQKGQSVVVLSEGWSGEVYRDEDQDD